MAISDHHAAIPPPAAEEAGSLQASVGQIAKMLLQEYT
jgi:hypothetical protein